jgi:hypothetical protein
MIRHGSTETARRGLAVIGQENCPIDLDAGRRLTMGRIAAAIASLDGTTRLDPERGHRVLVAEEDVHVWSEPQTVDTRGVALAIGIRNGGTLSISTGSIPEDSPFAHPPADLESLVRMNRATLSAARVAMTRIMSGDVVVEDEDTLRPMFDAACVLTSQVNGEDRERVLLSPRTPFAPLRVTNFASGERQEGDGERWEAEVRPAYRLNVSHHPNGSRIRFEALLLSCDETSPVTVMRAHARHAATSATPWWA